MQTAEQSNLIKVAVAELRVGMYVAEPDRPWLETPFLFQGFRIADDEDLAALREHCTWVLVPEQDVPPGLKPHAEPSPPAEPEPVPVAAGLFAVGAPPPVERPVEEELKAARPVHNRLREALSETWEALAEGGALKLDALREAVLPVVDSVGRNPDAILWLSRMRGSDGYVYQHALRSAVLAAGFGRHLGLAREDLETLTLGVLVMDVGKTRLPASLLQRQQPFADQEHRAFREHVPLGLHLLREGGEAPEAVLQIAACHHERWDGSGYPEGLAGERIPVFARIAGLVDSYDAMTAERGYGPRLAGHDALMELSRRRDTLFERAMVEQFIQSVGAFPTGSLVELNTGEVGIVIEQNRLRRLKPKVMLVLGRDGQPLADFRTVDLMIENQLHDPGQLHIARPLPPGSHGIDPEEYYL